jgi:hypothetical protein
LGVLETIRQTARLYKLQIKNTENRTDFFPSFVSKVTAAGNIQWPRTLHRESEGYTRNENRMGSETTLGFSFSPAGPMLSNVSLERFRTSSKFHDRPAAADIAFCVAAYACGKPEDRIERALNDGYLSRDLCQSDFEAA